MNTNNKTLNFRCNSRVVECLTGGKFYATAEISVTGVPNDTNVNCWKSNGTDCDTFAQALLQISSVSAKAVRRATADLKKIGAL